jgi:hypothetical protein
VVRGSSVSVISIFETFEAIAGDVVGQVQAGGSNSLMMRSWMVVFGEAQSAWLRLPFSSAQEGIAGLGARGRESNRSACQWLLALLFDTVVGDASGSAVVSLVWGRRLRMTEFFETIAQEAGFFFTIVEKGGGFGWRHWLVVQDRWEGVA